tara:strand:+ start:787 stop:1698 length:912 start_codon:yes stop_codon:yes gene_type:complete
MNKIFYWASDQSSKSGEGKLAKMFVVRLKRLYKNKRIYKIKSRFIKTNTNTNDVFFTTMVHKYLIPLYGVFNLWIFYLKKNETCYLNYLPLWNFLIFLFLPPKCILGPITGTVDNKRNFLLKTCLEALSSLIIRIRYDKIIFANNFYRKKFRNASHNFIMSNFKLKKSINKKKYDFVFYIRNEFLKKNLYIQEIINELLILNYKIAVIGGLFNSKKVRNFGYCSENKAKKIISCSKYSIANRENLFSFFAQDCLAYKLTVFYNSQFTKYQSLKVDNFFPINMDNSCTAVKQILKKLKGAQPIS